MTAYVISEVSLGDPNAAYATALAAARGALQRRLFIIDGDPVHCERVMGDVR